MLRVCLHSLRNAFIKYFLFAFMAILGVQDEIFSSCHLSFLPSSACDWRSRSQCRHEWFFPSEYDSWIKFPVQSLYSNCCQCWAKKADHADSWHCWSLYKRILRNDARQNSHVGSWRQTETLFDSQSLFWWSFKKQWLSIADGGHDDFGWYAIWLWN